MEKTLSVNNLVVSFRTPGGKVQAVRDISFDLHKGETLAIVGESGSGKSVTSKAILGILAGNSIIESGSIIYDGMDMLKLTEDDFHKIRGDKIAMIFQDPLSSLNPIMKIGRQLTEAMLLKGKSRQKSCREAFNNTLAMFEKAMVNAADAKTPEELKKMCKDFDKFEFKHIELEQAYNKAFEACEEAQALITDILFYIEKKGFKDPKYNLDEVARLCNATLNPYVVSEDADRLKTLVSELKGVAGAEAKSQEYTKTTPILTELKEIVDKAMVKEIPNFFCMGYYMTFAGKPLPEMSIADLNQYLRRYLDDNFMIEFRGCAAAALAKSADEHYTLKSEALEVLKTYRDVFSQEPLDKKACYEAAEKMSKAVDTSIDRLEIRKDGLAYTFGTSLKADLDIYFEGIGKNKKAAAAHAKQQAKYDMLVARGKKPGWKVPPSTAVNLELAQETVKDLVARMISHYEEVLATRDQRDYLIETEALVDFFKENASGSVDVVTKDMAKFRAIKLMEEVGIPDARKRYDQYPFEFSGGMRQRIVIAIALAANPDILICDEPTTALDVTIQAQILELINRLKEKRNLSIIFITHDLGVVANMADRIAVMYAGKIVETGTADDVFYAPAHPYTWALLSAMPDVDTNEKLESIPGTPPNMIYPPVGDAFADRNKYALQIDFEMQPPMFEISETHKAATWLLHPDAPKVEPPKIITERIARMKLKGDASNA